MKNPPINIGIDPQDRARCFVSVPVDIEYMKEQRKTLIVLMKDAPLSDTERQEVEHLIGFNLVAGTAGTATAYIDNAFVVNGNNDLSSAASSVPAVYDTQTATPSRVTRTVTSTATWGLNTAVGETFYLFGLRDADTNLLAITGYGTN